jgi:hypothetical protein
MTDDLDPPAIAARCAELVAEHYFDPAAGGRAHDALLAADYTDVTDASVLAERISADLQSVVPDLHLRLKYHLDQLVDLTDEAAWRVESAARARDLMSGVRGVQRLAGDVGLLVLAPALFEAEIVGGAINAAMTLLADTSALIIDLRELRGGSPQTVALVGSYLLPLNSHLNSMVPRDPAGATQSWTLPWVPGARFGSTKPVWVLTSATTFSGGEELAYDLQQTGRATVVGETTGGGANAREGFRVHPHLELAVPVVQARNPITGTNWEGVGVTPDVPAAAADALARAHRLALDELAGDSLLRPALRREIDSARELARN